MRSAIIGWIIGFAVLVAAFATTIGILNATIYSAHGFVDTYLDALTRHDATTARVLSGVRAPDGTSSDLLTADAIDAPKDVRLVHDIAGANGVHTVTYSYRLGSRSETTDFAVHKTGTSFGLFSQWAFTRSPLATVAVTVLHDTRFRANGTDVTSAAKQDAASSYEVFAPGLYSFDHASAFLVATPVDVPVTDPGSVTPVQVDVQPNSRFVSEVRSQLDKYFDTCATQKVLLPTSCPFGKSFNNRVVSTPSWSMTKDPTITIVPASERGMWLVPTSTGQARLKVKVQSLFDGTVSTFDQDVPFQISYSITIGANNHLTISAVE
jgi:hypothetical protein